MHREVDPVDRTAADEPVVGHLSAAALNATESFLNWYLKTDPSLPNDTQFLAQLTKVRTALHKAKQKAVEERIGDIVEAGQKVVVFTCFKEGIERHRKRLGRKPSP